MSEQHGNYVCLVLLCVGLALADPIAGPVNIVIERLGPCPREMLDYPFEFSVRAVRDRKNVRNWYYSINLTTSTVISDRYDLHMIYASWSSGGGWKENAQIMKRNKVCTTTKTYFPQVFGVLMKLTTGTADGNCPIPPGSYSIANTPITIDVDVPFFYGKWRVDSRIIDPKTHQSPACARCFSQTIPRAHHARSNTSSG